MVAETQVEAFYKTSLTSEPTRGILSQMITYLFMDCEMGGRELKYSLLTVYFRVTDSKFNKLGDLYLEVKPDDGVYVVSGQGMSVNKIDLAAHDKRAIAYKDAKSILFKFLSDLSKKVGGRFTPVGHGIKGDIEHVLARLISVGSWEQFTTYHYIDTSVVLQYLRACGKMDEDCDGSVTALADWFGIKVEGADHDCRVDTMKTLGIFEEFIRIGRDEPFQSTLPDFRDKAVKGPLHL